MKKIILAPVILAIAASDFLQLDALRRAHCWGWLGPEMDSHWERLFSPSHPDYGNFGHSAKNVLTEWTRLDAQRAAKLFAFLVCWLFVAAVAAIIFILW